MAFAGIGSGDALALATRFDYGWAYRGQQALMWKPGFTVESVDDEERSLLCVDGSLPAFGNLRCIVARFSSDRRRIAELRRARTAIRRATDCVVLFTVRTPESRVGFDDLKLESIACLTEHAMSVWLRGFELAEKPMLHPDAATLQIRRLRAGDA